MASGENLLQQLAADDGFDPMFSHPDITFADNSRTAILTNVDNDKIQCAVGRNVYYVGEHDIRIRLDYLPRRGVIAWIGMTSSHDIPINKAYPHPGMSGWSVESPFYFGMNAGIQHNNDLGKPWRTGDLLHLHLDCEKKTLRLFHSRTGKGQTIGNVVGAQRIFIAMSTLDTEIAIFTD